jgi:hypothetical protein
VLGGNRVWGGDGGRVPDVYLRHVDDDVGGIAGVIDLDDDRIVAGGKNS